MAKTAPIEPPKKELTLKLSLAQPAGENAAKRPSDDETNEQASKKLKTDTSAQELQRAEAALGTIYDYFSKVKDQVKAEASNAEEHGKQLAARDEYIRSLRHELRVSQGRLSGEENLSKRYRDCMEENQVACQRLNEERRKRQTEHNRRIGQLSNENNDLKSRLQESESGRAELERKTVEDQTRKGKQRKVMEAAQRVRAMVKGMPVENMGALGDALRDMGEAVDLLGQDEVA